jgi:carboxymethylenebutenolidase
MALRGLQADVMVTESDVNVPTPDGNADCYFVHPTPGVLIWPDISDCGPRFDRLANVSPNPAIRCLL